MAAPRPEDLKAGFLGLVVSLVFLVVLVFAVVKLTNAKFAGHGEPTTPPAAAKGAH